MEVSAGGCVLPLRGPKQRTLLAVLLLHANRAVSVDRLVAAIWDDAVPATVVAQVQAQVSALRAALARAGPDQPLLTEPPGYRLRVEPGQLDLDDFERLTCEARRALGAECAAEAADRFREALALWKGPALDGVTGGFVRTEAARLEELRLAALEGRIEADLALSRHGELVGELISLVAAHPLRERLRAQLMTALYREGRQAEALEVYRAFRTTLDEELGLEPGAELRRIEQAILTADPSLEPARAVVVRRPALLPADIADFTGREEEIAVLSEVLTASRGSAVPVAVVVGQAGVGKTRLALHTAHRLRARFPDGQLFADLRGTAAPAAPAYVLARFLRALGVDDAAIPDSEEERADLYRGRLADRRVLVVLDNVGRESQVRPLVPGASSCAVLVTSRFSLAGLAGARLLTVRLFEARQAIELLALSAGAARIEAEPGAAAAIVRACGYLPLAVRVAGARLAARPHWPLSRLAERLRDERRRLDELALGDLEVRASFALSYGALDTEQRRAFRLLGLLDGPDVAASLAAALDVAPERAEDLLDALADAHLLEVAEPSRLRPRYRIHDLLGIYARERAEAEHSGDPPARGCPR
jgi:DNA-binding SARP family transcriptional activator